MMQPSLKKDYFWNTIGVFLQNATSPLLLVVITRVNGIDTSGLFSFAFAISIMLFAFGLWGGRTYQVSDVKREFDHRSYIFTRMLLAVAMVIAAVSFALANGYDPYKSAAIIVLVVYKAVESIADSIYGVLQAHNGLKYAGKSLFYKSILGLILFFVIDIITANIILSSMGLVLVNIIFVVLYDARLARKLDDIRINFSSIQFYLHEAATILKRTAAIFAVTFLATFSINIPRFFIDKYDANQVGYFGIIAMPITLIALFMSFIIQPNIMRLSKMYEFSQYDDFKNVINKVMATTFVFGIVVAAAAYVIGIPLLNIVFGVDFSQHKAELMIMIGGGIANASATVLINVFTIIRKFKVQFYTLLVTNIALVALSIIFVQKYGIVGGVSSYALASIVQASVMAMAFRKVLQKESKK